MNDSPALLIKQKLDKLEMFCPALQKRNKYKISQLKDVGSSDFTGQWDDKKFKKLPHVMTAKEESTFCCRFCCMNMREFNMKVTAEVQGSDPEVYRFFRPFKCTLLCCCFLINPQEIKVSRGDGTEIGSAKQDWRCVDACLGKTYWKVEDKDGKDLYIIEDNHCCNANCFAPSLCCKVRNMDIYDDKQENKIGAIQNIFPDCTFKNLLRICSQTDSYKLVFPTGATPDQKALLLGQLMLIEYVMFEKSNDDDLGGGVSIE